MAAYVHDCNAIEAYVEFSGCGGVSSGMDLVPGVRTAAAANHDGHAIASHRMNFPNAVHFQEDLTKMPMEKMPWCHIFSASPACPAWTTANGVRREFDKVNAERMSLFDIKEEFYADDEEAAKKRAKNAKREEEYKRSRLLMKEVPRYLRAQVERGRPVPIGFVENVIQCRKWAEWDDWIGELLKLNYKVKVIAFNSMHARPVRGKKAPQSRNRLYVAFWHASLGRDPDWDKWLRPKAWCDRCAQVVDAVQVFKDPGVDMGSYNEQWVYRCPSRTCQGNEVFPEVAPALSIIDPKVPGIRIGDRESLGMPPLVPATKARIVAGIRNYWLPLLVPVGGTWRGDGAKGAQPLTRPFPARTTRETDGVAVPPLVVPVEGREGKVASPANLPIRTQTTRAETGVVLPMFLASLRGGGDKDRAKSLDNPLPTVTGGGNHAGIASPPADGGAGLSAWAQQLLVPYYGNSNAAQPAGRPLGTVTTHDRYGVARVGDFDEWAAEMAGSGFEEALNEVLFRMLTPEEVAEAMAFETGYKLSPRSKRDKVKLLGNAVTPPVAEILTSALVECMTGVDLERELVAA